MDARFLSIEEFNELLQAWNGQPIKITKHELNDVDETVVDLESLTYATNPPRIDGYEGRHALMLNGDGEIRTDSTATTPLPSSNYEIPLEDSSLYEFDGTSFLLSTERAVYKIELAH